MAHLRAYKWNGGDMLELVRAQRKAELPKAAGAENEVIRATEMLSYERKSYSELGKYVELCRIVWYMIYIIEDKIRVG